MKPIRQPWMIRAAFAVLLVGLILIAWSVLSVWIYRQLADVAPEWMLVERRGISLLKWGASIAFVFTALIIATGVTGTLARLLKVPAEAFEQGPGEDGHGGDYPFHRRRLSDRARNRPGQQGFFDESLRKFAEFSRNPLTPPARKPD